MPPPFVRLVVLNFNGGALVERCVQHLEGLEWPNDRLELVVVDNASTDGSDDRIEAAHPLVSVVRTGENLGFPGNNRALEDLAGVDFVGLVNNDAFVSPDWLRHLVDGFDDDRIGAVCPKILLADRFVDVRMQSAGWRAPGDGRDLGVQLCGARVDGEEVLARVGGHAVHAVEPGPHGPFRWLGPDAVIRLPVAGEVAGRVELCVASPRATDVSIDGGGGPVVAAVGTAPTWIEVEAPGEPYDVVNNAGSELVEGGWGRDRGFLERDEGQFEEAQDVFAWCGAGVLFRREYLEDCGLFDERFFMYYEDTDLSWRGRARGWRYRYVPAATMRHVHAATSVEGSAMFQHYVERNRLLMLLKNAPWSVVVRAVGGFLLSTASYARRDILSILRQRQRPSLGLVRARLRSLLAFLRLAPAMMKTRRELRRMQVVPDQAILGWAAPR